MLCTSDIVFFFATQSLSPLQLSRCLNLLIWCQAQREETGSDVHERLESWPSKKSALRGGVDPDPSAHLALVATLARGHQLLQLVA